jgi:hypothetical protein
MQQQTEPMPQRIIAIGLMGINIVADKPASDPPMLIKYPCGDFLSSENIFNPFETLNTPKKKAITARPCNIKINPSI